MNSQIISLTNEELPKNMEEVNEGDIVTGFVNSNYKSGTKSIYLSVSENVSALIPVG